MIASLNPAEARYRLYLLGPPHLERDGQIVEIGRRKALALLAYLALSNKSHSRETLATLFWPEAEPRLSRAALRRVLSDLNKILDEPWEATNDSLALRPELDLWVDALTFRKLMERFHQHAHPAHEICPQCLPCLAQAAELNQSRFLSGFSLPDSPEFDEWQFFESEGLQQDLSVALAGLVQHAIACAQNGESVTEEAINLARRWVTLEALDESPRYCLMQLYAFANQPAAALRQYHEYARLLQNEFGEGPGEAIQALHDQIQRARGIGPHTSAGSATMAWQASYPAPSLRPGASPVSLAEPQETTRQNAYPVAAFPTDEIRLATALFVGLSSQAARALELQPGSFAEAAQNLVRIVRQVAAHYQPHLERFIGQGMYVLFGLPQVHEDDAERALRAALEIQAAAHCAHLSIAIGASTGQVYYTCIDIQEPLNLGEASLIMAGPAPSLAARLQALAFPGQTLASASTYRQARRAFLFQKAQIDAVGNIAEPDRLPEVYQLLEALESPAQPQSLEGLQSRLVGREAELARLRQTLHGVLNGEGCLVAVVGEAGIGKSRLVSEVKQNAIAAWEQGYLLLWLESRCAEWRSTTSYWPFIDLFNDLLYFFSEERFDRAWSLVALLEEMTERGNLSSADLPDIGALLGNLLSLHFGNAWDERLKNASPEQVQRQTFQAIFDFIVALSRQQPLILVFEDLHWADDLSLDLLSLLMEAIPTNPILVFCLYRPGQTRAGLRLANIASRKIPDRFVEINLRELLPEHSLSLVRSLLGEPSSATAGGPVNELFVEEVIVKKSWGNPFFVEEAVRAWIDQGILYRLEGRWRLHADSESLSVPESVQSILFSRIDRLDADLKTVLRGASVLGWQFYTDILAKIVPAHIELQNALSTLEEAALVYRQRVLPETEYAFKHALIQDVVYQSIASRQRAELHSLAAEAIERRLNFLAEGDNNALVDGSNDALEQLAFHYQRSPKTGKAIEYLLKAGEKARRSYRDRQAIDNFNTALERWEQLQLQTMAAEGAPSEQARLRWKLAALTGLGQIYHDLGQDVDAERYLLQAIAVGQAVELETPTLVRLYYWLGEVLHWQRRYTEQIHLGQVGQALLAEEESETLEAALMNQIIAIGHLARGDENSFRSLTHRTAAFIQKLPYSEELRPPYVHIILSLYNDRQVEQAAAWLSRLQELAQAHHDLRALAEVEDYHWGFRFQCGDFSQALVNCHPLLERYPRTGDNFRTWRCQRDLAWGYLMSGELEPAEKYALQALRVASELSDAAFQAESHLILGLVRLCKANIASAVLSFQAAGSSPPRRDPSWTEWLAAYSLGRAYLEQGQAELALEHFKAILSQRFPQHAPLGWWFNRWPLSACLLSALQEALAHSAIPAEQAEREFQALHGQLYASHAPASAELLPRGWGMQPAAPPGNGQAIFADDFRASLSPGWNWVDPFQDSAFTTGAGLEICAANGRDLWHLNLGAPRLMRPLNLPSGQTPQGFGDFAVQAVCALDAPSAEIPTVGGLLLWQDSANFLRLVFGLRGPGSLSFEGCLSNQNLIVACARLPAPPCGQIILRLERREEEVVALVARQMGDSVEWYQLGSVAFPVEASLQTGLHAVGWIDRTIYHGAFPNGARMRFENFSLQSLENRLPVALE